MTAFQKTSIRQALGIVFMVGASVAQGAAPSVAGGWDTVCLSNRYVSLQIVPSIGGRVMAYGLGTENVLWVNPGLAGKAPPASGVGPAGEWLNYGGDKLWPAPQGWDNAEQWPGPPDAILDGGPYTLEHLPRGGCVAALRLTSGEDRRSGIQLSRVIRLHEDSTRVSFEATMKNCDNKPRRWGIWAHTQLDGGREGGGHNPEMRAYCPLNPKSHFTKGYDVIFGDERNPSFQADPKRGLMVVEYQYKVGKIGLDSPAGWVATVNGLTGKAFVQRFTFEKQKPYPEGSSVEFWLNGLGSFKAWGKENVMPDDPEKNPFVFESEMLGPLTTLQPGESVSWTYDWFATSIGAGRHEVVDCTEAGVVSVPLSATPAGGRLRLTGRFGVFAPGQLVADALDGRGARLSRRVLLKRVSPLEPLVLDQTVVLPKETACVVLLVQGEDGHNARPLHQVKLPN